ncbi:MAG: hypothetical protein IH629_00785 [Thermoleophilia bacterium]|nr:hypothetical protein [Thermoleophilia bacterium]
MAIATPGPDGEEVGDHRERVQRPHHEQARPDAGLEDAGERLPAGEDHQQDDRREHEADHHRDARRCVGPGHQRRAETEEEVRADDERVSGGVAAQRRRCGRRVLAGLLTHSGGSDSRPY